jgi:hypothetical protein
MRYLLASLAISGTALLTVACEPSVAGSGAETDGESESGGASTGATDGGGSSDSGSSAGATDGGSGSGSGGTGPAECPPNAIYASPGCGGDQGGIVPLPEPGCYEPCSLEQPDICSAGTYCARTDVDPCICDVGEDCCDACGAESYLCLPAPALESGFEDTLDSQDGCGTSAFSIGATSSANPDLLLTLRVGVDVIGQANESGQTQQSTFTFPSDDVSVSVSLGPQIASNLCNDAPFGTLARRYDAQSGSVDLTVEPATSDDSTQGIFSATLTNLELVPEDDLTETVTVDSYAFDAVSVWCCPG